MIIVECQTWISIHVYVVKEYVLVSMLLTLERIMGGARFDNLTRVLLDALQKLEDLIVE